MFPIFSKAFEKKLENSNEKKKIKNKNDTGGVNKNSNGKIKLKKMNKMSKSNKSDCFTEDINIIKQKKK